MRGKRKRKSIQNGSRDISYLIKLDCARFLIGLKLFDHDYQNGEGKLPSLPAMRRKSGIFGCWCVSRVNLSKLI
jgi:hypothetical protein